MILPASFYQSTDVVDIAHQLIGKTLITQFDGIKTGGIIVETEAYRAPDDKACHAYQNRLTPRTKTMFEVGGCAYIYLCYGIHHLFNVVTAPKGIAHAVLIRAIHPTIGTDTMLERRNLKTVHPRITKGPGALSAALGIHKTQDGTLLHDEQSNIQIHDIQHFLDCSEILSSKRIGVDYAEEAALFPWRFYVKGNEYVSG